MPVSDDERIFRAVEDGKDRITIQDGQRVRISTSAFLDPHEKPSVDLASLCGEQGPRWTQRAESDAVLRLRVGAVRAKQMTGMQSAPEPRKHGDPAQVPITYTIDVIHCPVKDVPGEKDNDAHAEIRPNTPYIGDKPFKRLKERLAKLARVEILPGSLRTSGPHVEDPETE